MNERQPVQDEQILVHFDTLRDSLVDVPELDGVFDFVEQNRSYAVKTYIGYVGLVSSILDLKDADRSMIITVHARLRNTEGIGGSASTINASELHDAVGDKDGFRAAMLVSADSDSPYYQEATRELIKRLQGGHRLRVNGKTPSDFDAASLRVIWGHTVITNPEALFHFTICHYLERYASKVLTAQGLAIAQQKDFLVNAMTDIVILQQGESEFNSTVFNVWAKNKPEGMGWITAHRLKSHNHQ